MTRRTLRVAEAIREVVSTAILFEVKDPRIGVGGITVLGCEVGGDLRTAKVFVSIMGDETKRRLAMHGLNSSRGFLQSKIAKRLDLRFTPILTIVEDDSVRKLAEMAKLLRDTGISARVEADAADAADAENGADDAEVPAPADGAAIAAGEESAAATPDAERPRKD